MLIHATTSHFACLCEDSGANEQNYDQISKNLLRLKWFEC
jgi:hypothetical protein